MSRLVLPQYTVVRDTREKEGHGWQFTKQPETKKPPRCNGQIIQKLDTGDYSVVGLEHILCLERKDDFSEIWTNYSNRATFEEECERMRPFKYKYILIESILTKDTLDLSPSQFTRSVPGRSVISWLISLGIEYGINIVYVGQIGQQYAQMLFQNIIRQEKSMWVPQDEKDNG